MKKRTHHRAMQSDVSFLLKLFGREREGDLFINNLRLFGYDGRGERYGRCSHVGYLNLRAVCVAYAVGYLGNLSAIKLHAYIGEDKIRSHYRRGYAFGGVLLVFGIVLKRAILACKHVEVCVQAFDHSLRIFTITSTRVL